MKKLVILAVFAGFLAFAPVAGFAEDGKAPDRVQIIEDDENGVVRFVIDGQEVMRLDANGLRVRGHIDYGGIITDVGSDSFDTNGANTGKTE